MLKNPVFATHITNLTDARYFAAMGVQYIGFELSQNQPDQVDIEFVRQIKEWLEGPSIIGCVQGDEDLNQLVKWVVDGQLDGLFFYRQPDESILENFASLQIFVWIEELTQGQSLPSRIHWVLAESDYNTWKRGNEEALKTKVQHSGLFLYGDFDHAFFQNLAFQNAPGLIVKGSEEEKVGFKSFDDLDFIFEQLEKDQ